LVSDRNIYRALLPERTPLQNGTHSPSYERCLEKDDSVTHPMQGWGHSLLKILTRNFTKF
jgi:hypothetical protein